jgi:hypothetical protein
MLVMDRATGHHESRRAAREEAARRNLPGVTYGHQGPTTAPPNPWIPIPPDKDTP